MVYKRCEGLNFCEWTLKLADKLELLRDSAAHMGLTESAKRKQQYDKGKVDRKLCV